jgi:acetyl-CoA carboxylase biotin carboxyl carrier protein
VPSPTGSPADRRHGDDPVEVKAEVLGSLWRIVAEVGQRVEEDETIMVLESMKMEIPVTSPISGTVTALLAVKGEVVQEGQTVAIVE